MSSIFDRSIISVPVYDAVYQRNTGRVPSIYFRRTHRQKGESRGKFNLFIAGSKRLPSPSPSLPAHEVVVRGIPGTRVSLSLPLFTASLPFVVAPRTRFSLSLSPSFLRLLRIIVQRTRGGFHVRKEGRGCAMRYN